MTADAPCLVLSNERALEGSLRCLKRWLAARPDIAAQVLTAFVQEGRRFAATPEGERWLRLLRGSPAARRGRLLWGTLGLDGYVGAEPATSPVLWITALAGLLISRDLEVFLADLAGEP
jgi:hypothetical protein